ncbi:putative Co/Zn/Cd cation transporter (cation efflux family) [Pseudomonas graminis]|uniref:cation diffusion facilitator family transporter n=1 Tax=Pseudomonas graminis TaxID=158627 RepID=UPI00105CB9F1|nr:cation transporter [Pseudomonas graminis]TDV57021.1 putative Co/Zn/Cd cation transporter (cation efflux family) [Pseudomonas graminis]
MTEPSVLRLSIIVTFALAIFGVVFGLLTGSASIIFDGVYTLIDAIMTSFALVVAKLIAFSHNDFGRARLTRNFTMGFWHLEPIVLGLSGTLLVGTAGYGLIMAVGSLMAGGRHLDFDLALVFALVALVSAVGMIIYGRRANKRLHSSFIALDVKAWTISAAMTGALLLAFLTGWVIGGTELEWLSPYIDPAVLALVCVIVLPIPLPTIRDALADVLLVTPPEMKKRVDDVAGDAVQRHGFLSYRAYVARVGRGRQIEIYFIVPPGLPPRSLEAWDLIRDEIGEEVGGTGPDRWLTIAFTVNKEWAE